MNSKAFAKSYGKLIILLILLIAWFAIAEETANPSDNSQEPGNNLQTGQVAGTGQESNSPAEQPSIEQPNNQPVESPESQQETKIDENQPIAEQTIEQPAKPEITIVSPLGGQTVNGSVIIIISVSGSEECAAVQLDSAEQGMVFEGQACGGNNYILDWDSETVVNGNYEISAKACIAENCAESKIPVIVENPLEMIVRGIIEDSINEQNQSAEQNIVSETEQNAFEGNITQPLPEEIPQEELMIVKGSNEFSILALKGLNGELLASGSEFLKAKKGNYNASIAFVDKIIKEIELENVLIDSNQTLLEVDENINEGEFESPEGFFLEIIAVNPKASFENGIMRLNAPSGSKALFKCKQWVFEEKKCAGNWEKIQEINGETILEIPISQVDPGFGFSSQNTISFNRFLNCQKCGQHKAPPTTNVQMEITASTNQVLENALLVDYFPASWLIVDAREGIVSDYNSEFKKIEWIVSFSESVSKTYVVQSPERTLPPTEYYFLSQLNEFYSDYWRVIVADPSGQSGSVFHFRSLSNFTPSQPMPDKSVVDLTFIGSTNPISKYGMDNSLGATSTGVSRFAGTTTTGDYNGVSFTSPPLAAQTINGGTWAISFYGRENASTDDLYFRVGIWVWADSNNARKGPILSISARIGELTNAIAKYTSNLNGSQITLASKDKIIVELDLNGITPTSATTSRADLNFDSPTYDSNIIAPQAINFYAQLRQPIISIPASDGNLGINQNSNFLVQGITVCDGNYYDCGSVDTNLQWCSGASCNNWIDMNSTTGALKIVSGSNPQTTDLTSGSSTTSTWTVVSDTAGTYELRLASDGNNTDANTSTGTDRTITIQALNYSFTISLPSTGCTEGKGCLTGGCTACTRCFFDASTGSGSDANFADRNQVACQGQTGGTSFFVFTNASTTSTAENWDINLDAAIGAPYKLKVGTASTAYQANCDDTAPPTTGCVNVLGTTLIRIANSIAYSGTQNAWAWADFVAATPVGDYNRTLYHTTT